MLRVNVLGSVYPTRAVVGGMKANCPTRGGGRVVFVSSQVAQVAIHGYTAYAGMSMVRKSGIHTFLC